MVLSLVHKSNRNAENELLESPQGKGEWAKKYLQYQRIFAYTEKYEISSKTSITQ